MFIIVGGILIGFLHVTVKRIVLIGAPGCEKKEQARGLREKYGMQVIETSALLKKEVDKKSDLGAKIEQSMKNREYGK